MAKDAIDYSAKNAIFKSLRAEIENFDVVFCVIDNVKHEFIQRQRNAFSVIYRIV